MELTIKNALEVVLAMLAERNISDPMEDGLNETTLLSICVNLHKMLEAGKITEVLTQMKLLLTFGAEAIGELQEAIEAWNPDDPNSTPPWWDL